MRYTLYFLLLVALAACQNAKQESNKIPEVVSLLGVTYFEPERSDAAQHKLDSNLNVALENFKADPSEENFIWYGRRLGYLTRFNQAIQIFDQGLHKYPDSYKLLRHRGHRFISMRLFDRATEDLLKATVLMEGQPIEIEPDGQPNKLNKPLSSVQFNVWYHLALSYYLKGEFDRAEEAYLECLKVSNNDDLLVATIDWLYMTYRRQGNEDMAKTLLGNITDSMEIIENDSYYKRLQMYQGKLEPESLLKVGPDEPDQDLSLATQGYGVGNWYLYNGDSVKAKEVFEKVVAGKHFSSFGFIAAEAELFRMKK